LSLDRNLEELVKDGGRFCSVLLGRSRGGRRPERDRVCERRRPCEGLGRCGDGRRAKWWLRRVGGWEG
ncbi:hypothetical protein PIB30_115656, partial [Stylosanthes scabra]|nr:hypothetical protein [Stylosanthes scabra]